MAKKKKEKAEEITEDDIAVDWSPKHKDGSWFVGYAGPFKSLEYALRCVRESILNGDCPSDDCLDDGQKRLMSKLFPS